jgi:hypothetical protein
MEKFNKILGISVACMFFFLGFYILLNPRFAGRPKEMKVIFAVFLFLYGAYRLVRYLYKDRDEDQ